MSRLSPTVRITILVIIVLGLAALAHFSGISSWLSRDRVAAIAAEWGALGIVVYIVLFAVAEIMQLPGAIFVVAAVAAYGLWFGTLIAYIGMNVASMAVFGFARGIAGRALSEVSHPRVQALMREVDRKPIRTAFVARGILFVLPGIGYALALSSIRFRDYVIGSAMGLAIPSAITALASEWLMRQFP